MRTYPRARVESGELVTPNEINDELRELVAGLNSLDRDNFGALSTDKVALGAWGRIRLSTSVQRIDVTHLAGPSELAGEVLPIPFDLGGPTGTDVIPWFEEFETSDGSLELSLSVSYTDDIDAETSGIWVGIRLNGNIVARSPMQPPGTYRDCGYCVVTVPVAARRQLVEPVYGRAWSTSNRTITFTDRQLALREIAR